MSVHLSAPLIFQFFDNSGRPAAGGSVLTQVGGVNTATYQDSAGTTALPNPIPLNARGEISNAAGTACQLFLTDGVIYTLTLYDANNNQLDSFTYVVGTSTSADIASLQSQITAFATSITTGTLTVTGSTTLGALSVGAITGTGAIAIGSNTLTCGAVTCGAVTSTGNMSVTGNIAATGSITAASFSTSAPNAASFLMNADATTGNLFTFNTNGTSTGSGISNAGGTITLANAGTYDVVASLALHQPTAAVNIDTGIYFGGTANMIVGPVSGNTERILIAGANGAVYALPSMRAVVVTNAANQTLTVNSTLSFSGTYQAKANSYITISQR